VHVGHSERVVKEQPATPNDGQVREHLGDVDQAAHVGEDHELGDFGEQWVRVLREIAALLDSDQRDHHVSGDNGAVVQQMHVLALVSDVDAGALVLLFGFGAGDI